MIKRIIGTLIFLSFLLQTFKGVFVIADYYANPSAFSINCINKSRPSLHCNGKCQMFQKLQKQEQKDQQLPERRIENKLEIITQEIALPSLKQSTVLLNHTICHLQSPLLKGNKKDFFHPPQV